MINVPDFSDPKRSLQQKTSPDLSVLRELLSRGIERTAPDGRKQEFLSYEKNKINLDKLISTYVESPEKIAPFLGAGVSRACGIPDWSKLIRSLHDSASAEDRFEKIPESDLLDSKKWPEISQGIRDFFERNNLGEKYFSILENEMNETVQSTTVTVIKLVHLFNTIITTNFDRVIVNAVGFWKWLEDVGLMKDKCRSANEINFPKFLTDPDKDKVNIYYLHGHKQSDGNQFYVFTKNDYDKFYPTVSSFQKDRTSLEDKIKALYQSKKILFLGFSFQDEYFKKYFLQLKDIVEKDDLEDSESYKNKIVGSNVSHFWCVDEESFLGFTDATGLSADDLISKKNLYPVVYQKDRHIFIEAFLDFLSRDKDVKYDD